ncbi:MAG: DUF748 domain-containing protein, partial [Desulfobulbaceae bacterium]|nr:DUF748 domain-containing protein [Desulfobulbaceae bacterium]
MKPLPPTDPFSDIPIAQPSSAPSTPVPGKGPSAPPHPPFSRQTLHPKKTSHTATFLSLLTIASIIYMLCGYFLIPFFIKSVVTSTLAQQLDRPVTVGIVDFNPLTLRLTLANGIIGPKLSDPDDAVDPIVSFSTLTFDLDLRSLPQRAIICQELTISQPFLHLVHNSKRGFNTAMLLPSGRQKHPWLSALLPSRYSLNNISITKGEIVFDDLPTDKTHHLQALDINLPTIANINYQNGQLTPHFSATVNGTPIEMTGQARMVAEKITASLNLTMTTLDLEAYRDYLPPSLGVQTLSGQADLDLNLLYAAAADVEKRLRLAGAITIHAAKMRSSAGEFALDSGLFKGEFNPATGLFSADEINLHHPVWQLDPTETGDLFDAIGLPPSASAPSQDRPLIDAISALLLPTSKQTFLPIKHLQITGGEIKRLPEPDNDPPRDWQAIDISINTAQPAEAKGSQQAFFTVNAKKTTGSQVTLQGSATTMPFTAKGLLVVNHTDINTVQNLWQRFAAALPVKRGSIEQLQANFSINLGPNSHPNLTLDPLSVQAKDLEIEQNNQLVTIPVWQSEQGSFSLDDPILHLGKIQLQQASITCRRQSSTATWQSFLSTTAPAPPATTAIKLDSIELNNSSLQLENEGPPDIGLRFERLDLQVESFDPQKENTVTAAAMLDDKYPVQVNGTFSMTPFNAHLAIQANDLPLSNFRPILERYFASPINGALSTEGTLNLPSLDYQGEWTINSLSAPPLSCRRLSAEGTTLSLRPMTLTIDQLTATGPALQVTAQENGMPELPAIMQPGWQPAPSSQEARVAIEAIDIEDGAIIYDLPNPGGAESNSRHQGLTLSAQKIRGSLEEVIVAKEQAIPFTFAGSLEKHADFTVQGIIRPFMTKPGLELKSQVTGLPLVALAPLLEPYWGFKITAGNLDFSNQLTYENTLIQDSSQLSLHDLSLGKRLAPEAIKALGDTWQALPAVQALLQDTSDTITLTIPIDGRTDTGFTYQTAMRAFLNQLLLKATVSPMNLLSNSQQTPDDIIKFTAGESKLGAAMKEQLNTLASLLKERPLLALNLTGFADGNADNRALLKSKKTQQAQPATNQATIPEKQLLSLAAK